MTKRSPHIDDVFEALSPLMCDLSPKEQRVALALYELLARGKSVRLGELSESMASSTDDTLGMLDAPGLKSLTHYNESGAIIGFGGLAVVSMKHRFTIDDRTLYTWCAWDGLFLADILGVTAEIESTCPETDAALRLTVSRDGVTSMEPEDMVLSFLLPNAPLFEQETSQTISSFCHYIHFLASPEAAEAWTARHEGTFVLSIADAFTLGKMNNDARFGAALHRAGS